MSVGVSGYYDVPTSVYVLFDPREPEVVRYVGISMSPPERFHLHTAAPNVRTKVGEWILGLKWRERRFPEMRVVAEYPTRDEAKQAERALIAELTAIGQADLNVLLVPRSNP